MCWGSAVSPGLAKATSARLTATNSTIPATDPFFIFPSSFHLKYCHQCEEQTNSALAYRLSKKNSAQKSSLSKWGKTKTLRVPAKISSHPKNVKIFFKIFKMMDFVMFFYVGILLLTFKNNVPILPPGRNFFPKVRLNDLLNQPARRRKKDEREERTQGWNED
jgi:hypothetical protein